MGVFLHGAMLEAWTEAKYYHGKDSVFFLCHHAVVSSDIVKLSASFWFAAVANGCPGGAYGKCFGVEDTVLMKVEVLV
jgi:hypothetical protein